MCLVLNHQIDAKEIMINGNGENWNAGKGVNTKMEHVLIGKWKDAKRGNESEEHV